MYLIFNHHFLVSAIAYCSKNLNSKRTEKGVRDNQNQGKHMIPESDSLLSGRDLPMFKAKASRKFK